jgi:hypothetical protein
LVREKLGQEKNSGVYEERRDLRDIQTGRLLMIGIDHDRKVLEKGKKLDKKVVPVDRSGND